MNETYETLLGRPLLEAERGILARLTEALDRSSFPSGAKDRLEAFFSLWNIPAERTALARTLALDEQGISQVDALVREFGEKHPEFLESLRKADEARDRFQPGVRDKTEEHGNADDPGSDATP